MNWSFARKADAQNSFMNGVKYRIDIFFDLLRNAQFVSMS